MIFRIRRYSAIEAPREPKMALKRPKMVPRRPKDAPRRPQERPKRASGRLKMAQEGPKRAPRELQEGPQERSKREIGPSLVRGPSRSLPGPSRTPPGSDFGTHLGPQHGLQEDTNDTFATYVYIFRACAVCCWAAAWARWRGLPKAAGYIYIYIYI